MLFLSWFLPLPQVRTAVSYMVGFDGADLGVGVLYICLAYWGPIGEVVWVVRLVSLGFRRVVWLGYPHRRLLMYTWIVEVAFWGFIGLDSYILGFLVGPLWPLYLHRLPFQVWWSYFSFLSLCMCIKWSTLLFLYTLLVVTYSPLIIVNERWPFPPMFGSGVYLLTCPLY